jgi:sigma-B regulation protein RsbU (phosphoserine phosphatase)
MVVKALNKRFQADPDIMQYFTMIYGMMDTRDGRTVLTQAGHPPPILVKNAGAASPIGSGGFPVGMFSDADYEENQVQLEKGDRLVLYSDGIIECTNTAKEQFSMQRLIGILEQGQELTLHELMENTREQLREWRGSDEFEDDMTLLALERV